VALGSPLALRPPPNGRRLGSVVALGSPLALRPPPRRGRCTSAVVALSPLDLLTSAVDGAVLESTAIAAAGAAAVVLARRVAGGDEEPLATIAPPPRAPVSGKVAIDVDLGANGEPKGVTRLFFKPFMPRSDLFQLQLRVPLGLVIEEDEANGHIVVRGALPGYSSMGQAEPGDLIRGLTCYAVVVAGAPMWQQVLRSTRLF
jgi:hypothetical protein